MKFTIISLLVSVLLLGCKDRSSKEEPIKSLPIRKPNVVLIIADDLGWADLGCYGNSYFESPALDGLASKGVRFSNFYSASHVCSPTRASILTGRYPARIGLTNYLYGTKTVAESKVLPAPYNDHLPLDEITIAEELKKDGYKTGLLGKWHLGENTTFGESDPGFQGFDVTEGFDYELLPDDGTYKWYKIDDKSKSFELPQLTQEITDNSIKFIERNKDTTFFMTVSHFAVHLPLQADTVLISKYEQKNNPRPGDFNPIYAAMIEEMDYSVGRILNSLEENRVLENTIILFISDNGGLAVGEAGLKPTVNDPLRKGKGTIYDGGIRVPMIAYWKNHWEGGRTNDSRISTIDIFPTILQVVRGNHKVSQLVDGKERTAAFSTDTLLKRESLYWHYPHFSNQGGTPKSAMIKDNMKLILSLEDYSMELYDINTDISEANDLSKERADLANIMKDSIRKWLLDTNAPMPIKK